MEEIFSYTDKSNGKIESLLSCFDEEGIAIHSFLCAKANDILSEVYYSPFKRETLHRMYSVTKSINALGIGILLKKGMLSLDDSVVSYFREYVNENTDERIKRTTLRNLLMMKSPFSRTCYKEGARNSNNVSTYHDNWVKSFFTVKPDHDPDAFFSYDTGSATVLSKIIEKVSGKSYIEFFKDELFKPLNISEDTYILSDSHGNPQGGSGLMMRPLDLLKLIYLVSKGGLSFIDESFIKDAVRPLSDTTIASLSSFSERRLGYGYQIWRVSDDAFAFIGLGGQIALSVASKDLVFVTTADTQGSEPYASLILKELLRLSDEIDPDDISEKKERHVVALKSRKRSRLNRTTFKMDSNGIGLDSVALSYDEDEGNISITKDGCILSYDFAFGKNKVISIMEESSTPALSSASVNADDTLSIWLQFIGENNGGLTFEIAVREERISMRMKLYGELMFDGYSGVLTGLKAPSQA